MDLATILLIKFWFTRKKVLKTAGIPIYCTFSLFRHLRGDIIFYGKTAAWLILIFETMSHKADDKIIWFLYIYKGSNRNNYDKMSVLIWVVFNYL